MVIGIGFGNHFRNLIVHLLFRLLTLDDLVNIGLLWGWHGLFAFALAARHLAVRR